MNIRDLLLKLAPAAEKRGIQLPNDVDLTSEMTRVQLVELRQALVRFSRATLKAVEANPTDREARDLEDHHEQSMAIIDAVSDEMKLREAQDADESELRAQRHRQHNDSRRPSEQGGPRPAGDDGDEFRGDDYGWSRSRPSGGPLTTWTTKDREEIRVFAPRDNMARQEMRGFPLGSILRSMVTGARTDGEKRALAEGTGSAGGFTVPTPLAEYYIDKLRRKSVVVQAGAMTVPMDRETLAIARVETDPQASWKLENDPVDETDMTFGRVELKAKTLLGLIRVSRELLDDSVNVDQAVENAFIQSAALEFDRACLYGSGTDAEPLGLANISGIPEVSMGTNGGALTNYDKLIDAVYEMQVRDAASPTAAVWHPRTGAALAKLKDVNNNPLTVPEMIGSIPKIATTGVPINETQGSATNASSIIFGDFRAMIIGMRSQIRIELLRERYADRFQYGFVLWSRADMQIAHKACFSRLKGIIPAA